MSPADPLKWSLGANRYVIGVAGLYHTKVVISISASRASNQPREVTYPSKHVFVDARFGQGLAFWPLRYAVAVSCAYVDDKVVANISFIRSTIKK